MRMEVAASESKAESLVDLASHTDWSVAVTDQQSAEVEALVATAHTSYIERHDAIDALAQRIETLTREQEDSNAQKLKLWRNWQDEIGERQAAEAQRDQLAAALRESDKLIRYLRVDLTATRSRADRIVADNHRILSEIEPA